MMTLLARGGVGGDLVRTILKKFVEDVDIGKLDQKYAKMIDSDDISVEDVSRCLWVMSHVEVAS